MSPEEQLKNSEAAQGRNRLAAACERRLMHLAYRALNVHELDPMTFLVVCIKVDSRWRSDVYELMPGNEANWQAERDRGAEPLALGIVRRLGFQERVLEANPLLRKSLTTPPSPRSAHLVVLDDTGGTVYDVPARKER